MTTAAPAVVKPAASPEEMVGPVEFEAALKGAMKAMRKAGMLAYLNVQGCCRGCVDPEKAFGKTQEQIDAAQIIWHYGGQGGRVKFTAHGPAYAKSSWGYSEAPKTLYFNHGGEGADAKAIEVFRSFGLNAYGGGAMTVCVDTPAPVAPEVNAYWMAVEEAQREADYAKAKVARIKRQIANLQQDLEEAEGEALDAEIAVACVGLSL